jgi:hypothetical protein
METETVEQTRTVGPAVGDLLVSSWGYDQTNIDFWRVVSLTESGKSVRIMPVAQCVVDYSKQRFPRPYLSAGSERVVPGTGDVFREQDEVTTSLIRWYGHGDRLAWCVGVPVGHKNTARLWDGRPVHQTAAGWGH